MSHTLHPSGPGRAFELRFHPLSGPGDGYAFPCDARGDVDLDALSDGERIDYLYARALMGCEFARPVVAPARQ